MLMDSMLLQALNTRPYLRLRFEGDEIILYNAAGTWEGRATTPYGATVMLRDAEVQHGLEAMAAEAPDDLIGLLKEYLSGGTIEAKVNGTVTLQVDPKVVGQLKHILHKVASA